MPDTPVTVDGQGEKFTITLPKGQGGPTRAFKAGGGDIETLELVPNSSALRVVVVSNSEGTRVALPLGTGWKVTIEEVVPK